MSPSKRPKPAPPSFRGEVVRRAVTLGVKPEDLDRALIIGQIAGLLARDAAFIDNALTRFKSMIPHRAHP